MYKKIIKTTDFNGNPYDEVAYFNLTKADLMELELGETGGFSEYITTAIQAQDSKTLIKIFKELILKSYGERSADGKHFFKSDEISAKFAATNAYSELFMLLATDADAATEFINGIAPTDETITQEQAKKFLEDKMK